MEKETSQDQTGVSTTDTTCNLPIGGDKKVLERKRPVEQRTERTSIQYWHCARSAWVVKRRIAHYFGHFLFLDGSLEDIAVPTSSSEQSNIRAENKL